MDKISVIIPVYNVEKFLDECLTCVVNQTYQNLEIILVDDGATDKSGIICDSWAKKDSRIIVIHNQNGGASCARNAGLKMATGKYFCFIDSDDCVDEDYVKILKECIDSTGADLAITSHVRFIEELPQITLNVNTETHDTYEAYKRLANWHKDYSVVWGNLYLADKFKTLYFIEGKGFEDEFYVTDLYLLANKISYNPSQTYFYRDNPSSVMSKSFNPSKIHALEAMEYRDNFYIEKGYTEFLRNNRMSLLFSNICLYYDAKKAGYKKEAKQLRQNYKKWYKVDKKAFPKMDKIRFWLFRYIPFLYKFLFELNRKIKCKKK